VPKDKTWIDGTWWVKRDNDEWEWEGSLEDAKLELEHLAAKAWEYGVEPSGLIRAVENGSSAYG